LLGALWAAGWACAQEEAVERKQPPGRQAEQAAAKLVQELFAKELLAARKPAERAALAKKLLGEAIASESDEAGQFVLFRTARDLAQQAGDVGLVIEAIDEANRRFVGDPLAEKAATLAKIDLNSPLLADPAPLIAKLQGLQDACVKAERFELTKQVAAVLVPLGRKTKDLDVAKAISTRAKEIEEIEREWTRIQPAIAKLKTMPDDAVAATDVGRFRAFVQGRFQDGLPLLAKGSDAALKSLIETEKAANLDSAARLAIGDAWWGLGEQAAPIFRQGHFIRAASWYVQVRRELTGLTKSRVEKRLETLGTAIAPPNVIRFSDAAALEKVRLVNGREKPLGTGNYALEQGRLVLRASARGALSMATARESYDSISSIRVRGLILPPNKANLRVRVGEYGFVFNLLMNNQNAVIAKGKYVRTNSPHALTPGTLHEVLIEQVGPEVKVAVDGKPLYNFTGTLAGEVSVLTMQSAIAIEEVRIEGTPAP
jgi:hypothetical protein